MPVKSAGRPLKLATFEINGQALTGRLSICNQSTLVTIGTSADAFGHGFVESLMINESRWRATTNEGRPYLMVNPINLLTKQTQTDYLKFTQGQNRIRQTDPTKTMTSIALWIRFTNAASGLKGSDFRV
jgi:hypothetical protein